MKTIDITEYRLPNGGKFPLKADISDEVADMSNGMVLSCERLTTGQIAVYATYPILDPDSLEDEDEFCEIAVNGPGERSTVNMLEKVIRECYSAKKG